MKQRVYKKILSRAKREAKRNFNRIKGAHNAVFIRKLIVKVRMNSMYGKMAKPFYGVDSSFKSAIITYVNAHSIRIRRFTE